MIVINHELFNKKQKNLIKKIKRIKIILLYLIRMSNNHLLWMINNLIKMKNIKIYLKILTFHN